MSALSSATQFPGRHEAARFRGAERRSSPLPAGYGLSPFGTVSHETHWQALASLSWLSSSRPSDFPRVPESVRPGSACHQAEAPHASQVERAYELARAPWMGFEAQPRTHFELGRPQQIEVCPHRPHSKPLNRIECRDYSVLLAGLPDNGSMYEELTDYSGKPPSNRTNTSRRIRLYGRPRCGWLDRSLSLAGEARFTGCGRLAKKRQPRSAPSYDCARLHETCV